jgi:3',5'-cyclic-AMP phosphodiesterase
VLIAQISDTHIKPEGALAYGRIDTSAFLARAVDHILHLDPRPDVVLGTGDLVDGGTRDEYTRLRHLLSPLPMPVYLIPGNHDDRDTLRQTFSDYPLMPRDGFIQYVVEDGPLRLIAVDTLLPRAAGGRVDAERLAWLDARLGEAPTKPTMIFMHHPPFKPPSTTWMGSVWKAPMRWPTSCAATHRSSAWCAVISTARSSRGGQARWR